MNDRQDPYAQQQVYGYDAYGQPVYRPDAPERAYDQYGQPLPQSPHGQQYGQSYEQQSYEQLHGQSYGQPQGQPYGHDAYGQQQYPQQQPQQQYGPPVQAPVQASVQQEWIPRQADAPPAEPAAAAPAETQIPEPRPAPDYRTEQFSFIEEPDEDSEDVIDWLKFSESRTERRDERKRKGRNRFVALAVVLVLAVAGGVGWFVLSGDEDKKAPSAAGGAQKRDVIVVHLRQTRGGDSATVLLVDNATTKKATAVLVPNALAVAKDGGSATTLGKSVQEAGTGGTRDALNTLLGSDIKGSWRLDTPYLENLVELVGGITVDTDTTVPGAKPGESPLVEQGKGRSLGGRTAVAYATYRGPGEDQGKPLARFGQVMQAVLRKMSSDARAATTTVESLAQIPDPSLSVQQLGASLAHLAEKAKEGSYATTTLPVQPDGTLGERAADTVVKDVLGGTVKNTDKNAPPRIGVKNATGGAAAAGSAQVTLVNGGYTYVDGGTVGTAEAASSVIYADEARAAEAKEVAKTLGLPERAVKQGKGMGNADVTVVLGKDYKG
ncbi:LCP family protein [Streptomyces cinnamoneus]|uniref:LCP family protein n=1 Tax=Streptomyces cinnamoneus TaxID=53446 RepID=UPI003427B2F6